MGTTADKLNHLIKTKESIRQEINRAYGAEEVSTSDTFNSYIQKLEDHPFYLLEYIERTIKNVKVSDATVIGNSAFYNCSNLSSASFPIATRILDDAFRLCLNLTTASFPKLTQIDNGSTGSIKSGAFYACTNLTTLYIGTETSSVCTLGTGAFQGCKNLTNIYVPASLVDSYKSATNWSSYASKIKAAP